jgi:hypothetical protein
MWTEEAWQDHMRRRPGIYSLDGGSRWDLLQLPVLLAVCLPVLIVIGANATMMWIAIAVGALISGLVTRRAVGTDASPALSAGAFLCGIVHFALLAEVVLLGGCCWPTRLNQL